MLTFAFVLTVITGPSADVYVMDYGLTGEDCIERIRTYVAETPDYRFGFPACEPDVPDETE